MSQTVRAIRETAEKINQSNAVCSSADFRTCNTTYISQDKLQALAAHVLASPTEPLGDEVERIEGLCQKFNWIARTYVRDLVAEIRRLQAELKSASSVIKLRIGLEDARDCLFRQFGKGYPVIRAETALGMVPKREWFKSDAAYDDAMACYSEYQKRLTLEIDATRTALATCKQCNGKRTIQKYDGGTHYETDSEAEFRDHYRTIPCPECCPAPK